MKTFKCITSISVPMLGNGSNLTVTRALICTSLTVLLSACAGNSLAPKNSGEISVRSEPTGAEVYVMDKPVGVTPMDVAVEAVYPVTYDKEDAQYYGHITLKREGCNEQTIKVSSAMVSSGLTASLDCLKREEAPAESLPSVEKSAKQRLQELQSLRDEGLISEQEYQDVRIRILKSL